VFGTVDSRCPSQQQHLCSFHVIENGLTAHRRRQCVGQSNKQTLYRRVGSTCLAGWRRHVLLWVLLLWSVVVVADIRSDVERLCMRAEAWLIARRNCSLLCDPLSYCSMHASAKTSKETHLQRYAFTVAHERFSLYGVIW